MVDTADGLHDTAESLNEALTSANPLIEQQGVSARKRGRLPAHGFVQAEHATVTYPPNAARLVG